MSNLTKHVSVAAPKIAKPPSYTASTGPSSEDDKATENKKPVAQQTPAPTPPEEPKKEADSKPPWMQEGEATDEAPKTEEATAAAQTEAKEDTTLKKAATVTPKKDESDEAHPNAHVAGLKSSQSESEKPAIDPQSVDKIAQENKKKETEESINKSDIGAILLKKKVISDDQLDIAQREFKRHAGKKSIGGILVEMGFITEGALSEIVNESSGTKKLDLKSLMIDTRLVKKIPKDFAIRHKVIPVAYDKTSITVAISDIFDIVTIDQVTRFFPSNFKITPIYAPEIEILSAIDQYYDYEMSIDGILNEIESGEADSADIEGGAQTSDYSSPVVRLVDALFTDALHHNASDIHFEPEEFFLRIRYRVDGKMVQVRSIHKDYWPAIAVRIKIMSKMNIAENRVPQDGRINTMILGRNIDFRVSAQPTVNGENIVLRILDEKQSILDLDKLGFDDNNIKLIRKLLQRPEGMIILTGPTGSGKTTTLYTMLNSVNTIDKNIMTLEDPVEYHIPLIRQSNIRHDVGLDFASGIRALLRQDPDVILVGEVRDQETAMSAVQAAMTGHQVYTSLHTNDALSAVSRLQNIGVPPFLLAGSLICVVAQRLARRLCAACKKERPINDYEKKLLGEAASKVTQLYEKVGCKACGNLGYKGRITVNEVLPFDKEMDELVANSATKKELLKYAREHGFQTMSEDGINKVISGVTDLDEIIRVVDMTDRM